MERLSQFDKTQEMTPLLGAVTIPELGILTEKARRLTKSRYDEVRAKYGDWISDELARQIQQFERSLEPCKNCTGLPCKKESGKHQRTLFEIDADTHKVNVRYETCNFRKVVINQSKFKQCKIPPKYIGLTFDSYEVTKLNKSAVDWAKWAVQHPEKGILFYGIPGCGKTHLVSIIAQEQIKRGCNVIFGDVPSILDDLKATFNKSGNRTDIYKPSIDELMVELQNVDVLVLDDIGTEYGTEWALERLYMIVNNRYNVGKPIIATSNFNAEQLEARFKENITGKRIISRLCEICKPVELRGHDRRVGRR